MLVRLDCLSLDACPAVAKKILSEFKDSRIFAFEGKMGSGKTTMIRYLCNELGVSELTSSPSFSLLNEYKTSDNKDIYHFDFYRIKDIREAYDIGYEEYFYSGKYCFIEWPEKIKELLPENCVYIRIENAADENSRTFVYETDQ